MLDAPEHDGQSQSIRIELANAQAMHDHYMPFITNGGLFVPATLLAEHDQSLGNELALQLVIHSESEPRRINGRIIWRNSARWDRKTAGVGVQFLDKGETKAVFERQLSGQLDSEKPGLTL